VRERVRACDFLEAPLPGDYAYRGSAAFSRRTSRGLALEGFRMTRGGRAPWQKGFSCGRFLREHMKL
jgi:hypothetical protein